MGKLLDFGLFGGRCFLVFGPVGLFGQVVEV